MNVTIIGAGFSGLTLAYYLNKLGFGVHIIEKKQGPGGLLQTKQTPLGLVESAANGLLMTIELESMLKDLDIAYIQALKKSKKRYIFKNGWPQRWPLGFLASLRFFYGLFLFMLPIQAKKPKEFESVQAWASRLFGKDCAHFLVSPALQGIYATQAENLSATLITKSFFTKKKKEKAHVRGSVSFKNGMGGFIHELSEKLIKKGVTISYQKDVTSNELKEFKSDHPVIIATSLTQALKLVPDELEEFKDLPMCDLTSITNFYAEESQLDGFGILYAKNESVHALGTLFNKSIFEGRATKGHGQTWIFEGVSEKDYNELIRKDQGHVFKEELKPTSTYKYQWPAAFPRYGVELEKLVTQHNFLEPIITNLWLTGNYFGHLGLAKILSFNHNLAQAIYEKSTSSH